MIAVRLICSSRFVLVTIATLAGLSCQLQTVSANKVARITLEQFHGVWIGTDLWEPGLSYYRLELHPDCTGLFATVFLDSRVQSYRIRQWTLKQSRIAVEIEPANEMTATISLEIDDFVAGLKIKIQGGNNYQRSGLLIKEKDAELAFQRLKTAMQVE